MSRLARPVLSFGPLLLLSSSSSSSSSVAAAASSVRSGHRGRFYSHSSRLALRTSAPCSLFASRHGAAAPSSYESVCDGSDDSQDRLRFERVKERVRGAGVVAAEAEASDTGNRARNARGRVCAATAMQQVGDGGVRARHLDHSCRRDVCARCATDGSDDRQTQVPDELSFGNSHTKLLTLPTILTLTRVAAVPALLAVFYSQETWATTAGATIFVLAAVTDWLDGYLARKMGSSSEFGAFLDPVADKLMVATTLVLLCTRPPAAAWAKVAPWLLPLPAIAIIGREITMSALREWAASQGGDIHKAVAVNNLGKWKTALQMVALTLLLVTRDGGGGAALGAAGISLLYIAAGLALWSLAVYVKILWNRLAQ